MEAYQTALKLRCWPFVFTLYRVFFYKRKESLELVSLPHFLYKFWKIIFCKLCSINWFNFITWLSLLLQKLGNICIVIICCPDCDAMYFEITLNLLIQPFFYIIKKSTQKYKYLNIYILYLIWTLHNLLYILLGMTEPVIVRMYQKHFREPYISFYHYIITDMS